MAQAKIESLKMLGQPVPEDLLPYTVKGGACLYISKRLINDAFNRVVRPHIRRRFEHEKTSNDTDEVAGFVVGVRRAKIVADIKVDNLTIELNPGDTSTIRLIICDEVVTGELQFHVEKEAKFFKWSLGDYHNKDYLIDFTVKLKKISSSVSIVRGYDGIPVIEVKLDLEDFNLKNDTNYHIRNKDILTAILDVSDGIWMPIVEKEIRNNLICRLNYEINDAVNDEIRKVYKTSILIENGINFRLDLRYESFNVSCDFLRLSLNGHIENQRAHDQNDKSMLTLDHTCGDLMDISSDLVGNRIHIQIADCVIYSAIHAYFKNDLKWSIPLEGGMVKGVTVSRQPEHTSGTYFIKSDRVHSPIKDYAVSAEAQFIATVNQKYLPDVVIGANIGLMVTNIELADLTDDRKVHLKFKVHDISVKEVYNSKMEPLTSTGTKGMVELLKKKAAELNFDHSIQIEAIPLEGHCSLLPMSLISYRNFFLLTATIEF